MKTCHNCGEKVEKKQVEVKIGDTAITDVYAEACGRCGEKYFDSKTATFIQKVASFIEDKKKEYLLEVAKGTSTEA